MKKAFFTAFLGTLVFNQSQAQPIDSLLLMKQAFETPFNLSSKDCIKETCGIYIYDNFYANEALISSRIYRETAKPISGTSSMGMTPTSEFNPTLTIQTNNTLDVPSIISILFDAKSLKNGGEKDTRASEFSYTYIINGTRVAIPEALIARFENTEGTVQKYLFQINVPANSKLDVILVARRGKDLAGSAAKVIVDNLEIWAKEDNKLDITNHLSPSKLTFSISNQVLIFNKPENVMIIDALGKNLLSKTDCTDLDLSILPKGVYIIKTEQGVTEKIRIQ
jgi:hypothetical protein